MKIKAESLTDTPLTLTADEAVAEYPVLSDLVVKGDCAFLSPVHVALQVSREFDHIRVHGQVSIMARLSCARCLVVFDQELASQFTIFYARSVNASEDEEVALSEEDLVMAYYDGDIIDFTHEIEEQLLMELPCKPLCHEECKGLCIHCGADRNAGECDCDRSAAGSAFSVLKNLMVNR